MPCDTCDILFAERPCTDAATYQTKLTIKTKYQLTYLRVYFQQSKLRCPCIECLVRPMCIGRKAKCPEYSKFLESLKE